MVRPFDFLKNEKLLDWETVHFGFKKGYLEPKDISDYATEVISDLPKSKVSGELALLAISENLENQEIEKNLSKVIVYRSQMGVPYSKWKLAKLSILNVSSISDQEKLDELQVLYADFGYPDDMKACSIYENDGVCPLQEMKRIINDLRSYLRC